MEVPETRNESRAATCGERFEGLYEELRRVAERVLQGQGARHTLRPTALVHEAYLRLAGAQGFQWRGRPEFLAYAARCIRTILLQYERRRRAVKRGGLQRRVVLDDEALAPAAEGRGVDLLALEEALEALAALDRRQAHVVEMRFFGGMTNEEVAAALDVSPGTVKSDWRFAKAWLRERLGPRG